MGFLPLPFECHLGGSRSTHFLEYRRSSDTRNSNNHELWQAHGAKRIKGTA